MSSLAVAAVFRALFQRQADPPAEQIHIEDGHHDLLMDFDNRGGILDEAIRQLADVDQAVLMDADIDEGPEGGYIRDNPRQSHAGLDIFDFIDFFCETEHLKLLARISAGFGQLLHNVIQRRQSYRTGDIILQT